MNNKFKGLGIALVTPFDKNGEVDYVALRRLLDYQLSNGADFLCILATTAETPCRVLMVSSVCVLIIINHHKRAFTNTSKR